MTWTARHKPWADRDIGELKRLWKLGQTTQEIADYLGINKHAASYQAYKLKLGPRPKAQRRAPRVHADRRSTPRTDIDLSAMRPPLPSGPPPRRCQFPHGDVGEPGFHYCGAGVMEGSPYCAAHYLKTHVSTPGASSGLRARAEGLA